MSLAEQNFADSIHGKQGPQQIFTGSLAGFMVGRVKQAARTLGRSSTAALLQLVMQIVLLCKVVDVVNVKSSSDHML